MSHFDRPTTPLPSETVPRTVLLPNFDKRGGVCVAIAQDAGTGQILMQGYADRAAYLETLATGEAVYYSTSRKKRWKKGETSGHVQIVKDVLIDCDGDAIVYVVEQCGSGACHTNAKSCFYRDFQGRPSERVQEGESEKLETIDTPVAGRLVTDP
ncbi:MAG: phosphoribosyl-AMP cyclohydrolase [Verrucomicrobiae bacterium]|nr:phosphoribosyl-AMP cyclohydrolase [Verrucomicrobiae bacterium]